MEKYIIKILSGIGIIILSWLAERIISFINSKIKNDKAQKLLCDISTIVLNSVKSTYQEYVESLKAKDLFDEKAQKKALNMATNKIKSELTEDMSEYIENTFGDVNVWINTSIHSALYDLKN